MGAWGLCKLTLCPQMPLTCAALFVLCAHSIHSDAKQQLASPAVFCSFRLVACSRCSRPLRKQIPGSCRQRASPALGQGPQSSARGMGQDLIPAVGKRKPPTLVVAAQSIG